MRQNFDIQVKNILFARLKKMMSKKWFINQVVSVVLVSLIFLSFQSTMTEGFSFNDKPLEKNVNENTFLFKGTSNTDGAGDSALNYFETSASELYNSFGFHKWNKLKYDVFVKAYKGYLVMKNESMLSNNRYLTVMDFELSANLRRMWVLDLEKHRIVIHDLVSHGRNTGEEYAHSFSNNHETFKSSLGFYVTGVNYMGKNDYSLRLHGVEEGFNDNAFDRGIVMHGAEYVCNKYICNNKRLGRSQGCPAVPQKINKWLINTIEGGSCLFIYYPDKTYLKKSEIINADIPKDCFNNI
ncbi:MAG: murein L,D-transpeptidase catalytic domain family protein [Bacteroidia bacterium]